MFAPTATGASLVVSIGKRGTTIRAREAGRGPAL